MEHSRYPQSFRSDITQQILRHSRQGMSLSLLGLPGIGKTDFLNHIISYCDSSQDPRLCLHIDINDLAQVSDIYFFKHVISLLLDILYKMQPSDTEVEAQIKANEEKLSSDDPLLVFNTTKRLLSFMLSRDERNICIFIDGLSKLSGLPTSFFNNLRSLRTVDKFRISYIFVDDVDLPRMLSRESIGDLYELVSGHIIWIPLPTKEEAISIIHNCEKLIDFSLTHDQVEDVYQLSQGHASLTKYLVHYLSDSRKPSINREEVVSDVAVRTKLARIIESFSPHAQSLMRAIAAQGGPLPTDITDDDEFQILVKSNLVIFDQKTKKAQFFSPLFMTFLKANHTERQHRSRIATLEPKPSPNHRIAIIKGNVYVEGKKIDDDLTQMEIDMLQLLVKNTDIIVSRDDIAAIMWREKISEKYSDWAIDRAISRLRKKIGDDAYKPRFIKTLRKRGFKLIS